MSKLRTPEERFGPGYENLSTRAKLSWLDSYREWERKELEKEAEDAAAETNLQIAIVLANAGVPCNLPAIEEDLTE